MLAVLARLALVERSTEHEVVDAEGVVLRGLRACKER